jgi:hypothetical protein
VTGENQIKLIKYVGIGGQPCEERPAVTSPDADFLITRVFTEASTVQGSQAMTKLILDAISKVDGGPSAPTDVQAVAEAVANELAQRLES